MRNIVTLWGDADRPVNVLEDGEWYTFETCHGDQRTVMCWWLDCRCKQMLWQARCCTLVRVMAVMASSVMLSHIDPGYGLP